MTLLENAMMRPPLPTCSMAWPMTTSIRPKVARVLRKSHSRARPPAASSGDHPAQPASARDRLHTPCSSRVDSYLQVTTTQTAVEDAGVGFPEPEALHLFDPFFTTKPHGLGMGLSISR
jgi:hypothetical protein